jgi:hypothetical protein
MRMFALAAVLAALAVSAGWGGASGSAAISTGDYAGVTSISCVAAGDCAAGGSYRRGQYQEAFVVSETGGSWGTAIEVPGTANLNTGGKARVVAISCAASGECAAGGFYLDRRSRYHAFVVSETGGNWGNAKKVAGTPTPIRYAFWGAPGVSSVSCPAAGECAASGYYVDGKRNFQGFVLRETGGSWGNAITEPSTAKIHGGNSTAVNSISCAAVGECVAGGPADDSSGSQQAFVVNETNGVWGNAIKVPGTAALNTGGVAGVNAISCPAVGECTADGYDSNNDVNSRAFVASETNGSWGTAVEIPTATLRPSGWVDPFSISCPAAGECATGGGYTDSKGRTQAFVAGETGGSWSDAIEVPGMKKLNSGGYGEVDSVSCAAAGECSAGGRYKAGGRYHAFVVSETGGSWGTAINVPGTTTLRRGSSADVNEISCPVAGECAAGGFFTGLRGPKAFVVDETSGSWANATLLGSFPASCVVPDVAGRTIARAKNVLHAADCNVGKITHAYSRIKKGRVIAELPRAGTSLSTGAKVALTVSKGRKS